MRAYVAITPSDLRALINNGSFKASTALMVSHNESDVLDSDADTEEELEFELSLQAAMESRTSQGPGALGMVLAVDLTADQIGARQGSQVDLLSDLSWNQVDSLLVADSDEPELSWFAAQEIPTYLPQWLA